MRPELILHVGAPKTGTTALQIALADARGKLHDRGVLYPGTGDESAHHFLALPLDFETMAPRILAQAYGRSALAAMRDFEARWAVLEGEIRDTRPRQVIMSSEYLFDRITASGFDRLEARIRRTFDRVTVVAYLRQPSRELASTLQQHIKLSGKLFVPRPVAWRRFLAAWEDRFPGSVSVRKYEAPSLVGGDIASDFLSAVAGLGRLQGLKPVSANASMSAEAAAILQDFQRMHQPGRHDRDTPEKVRLRRLLARIDARIPGGRPPALRPDVARYVDEGSVDLLWIRDHFGIVFDDVDYGRIGPQDAPDRPFAVIEDFFRIDGDRMRRMRTAAEPGLKLILLLASARRGLGSLVGRPGTSAGGGLSPVSRGRG